MSMRRQAKHTKRKRRLYITLLGIVIILVLSVLIVYVNYKSAEFSKETETLLSKTVTLKTDMKDNMDELNDNFMAERLKKIFSKNDLYLIVYQLWDYKLYANDTLITSNTVTLPAIEGKITITVKETPKPSVLPKQILALGKVTRGDAEDKLSDHFSVTGSKNNTITENSNTTCAAICAGLQKNSTLKIKISDQLAEKLNFNFNEISLTVK